MKRNILMLLTLVSLLIVGCSGGNGNSSNNSTDISQISEAVVDSSESNSSGSAESTSDDAGQEKIEIVFWYPFSGAIQEANEMSVDMFNQSQDRIHVTASTQGNYADVEQKVRQSVPAGTAPDVFINLINTTSGLGQDGVTQSLTPYIENDPDFDISDFYEGMLESSQADGDQYGLPYFNSTCLLYYNATMFEEKGIDPARLKTWDGFAEVAQELTDGGVKGVSNNENYWVYESMIRHFGESLYNDDYTRANFDTEAGIKSAEIMVNLTRDGYWDFPIPMTSETGETAKQNFFSQNCAMFFASTANLTSFLQGSEDNGWELGAVMLPEANYRAASVGGSNIVMINGLDDEKAQAVWEFIKFMTSEETNAFASEHTGYLPIRQSVAESEARASLEEGQPLYSVAREQLEFTAPAAGTGDHSEVGSIWRESMEALMTNDSLDITEAMEDISIRSESIMSN